MNGQAGFWFEQASYDLRTAQAMFATRRYLYVIFMCHQCLEKSLKGCFFRERKKTPPFTHNLLVLLDSVELKNELKPEQVAVFQRINPFNITARYPKTKADFHALARRPLAATVLQDTRKAFLWLRKRAASIRR